VKLDPKRVEHIVLVRIGKIGDLIVSNFAIRKVRASFPSATIHLVTLPRNRELLLYSQDVDRVMFFRRGADIIPLLLRLRAFHADILLDFNDSPSSTSALIARWGGAGLKVGFAFEKNRRFLSVPVECPPKEQTHITERLRKIPEAIGLQFDETEIVPSMTLGEREAKEVDLHLSEAGAGGSFLLAVNVSAGSPSRYWQVDRWKQLLTILKVEERGAKFLMLSAPGEEKLAADVASVLPVSSRIFPLYSTLHHFAAYIAKANLLISPDTSAVHIASAFQVPVIGLYPAVEWNFQSWHPMGTLSEAIRPPDGLVSKIGVEDVVAAFRRMRRKLRVANPGDPASTRG